MRHVSSCEDTGMVGGGSCRVQPNIGRTVGGVISVIGSLYLGIYSSTRATNKVYN